MMQQIIKARAAQIAATAVISVGLLAPSVVFAQSSDSSTKPTAGKPIEFQGGPVREKEIELEKKKNEVLHES